MKMNAFRKMGQQMNRRSFCFWGIGAWILTACSGCSLSPVQPDFTRYFVLTSRPAPSVEPSIGARPAPWRIGLRSIEVPLFLRNKAILVRLSANEVRFIEEARWAESLDQGLARVLRENLESRPDVDRVVPVATISDEERDFDVLVRVLRCEGGHDGGVARFSASIEISSAAPNAGTRTREIFTTEVPGWDGNDYDQLAQKLSTAIAALADRIVALAAAEK